MQEKWVVGSCKVLSKYLGRGRKPALYGNQSFGRDSKLVHSESEAEELPVYAELCVERRIETGFHVIKISFFVGL
jgi:hypothetical protein